MITDDEMDITASKDDARVLREHLGDEMNGTFVAAVHRDTSYTCGVIITGTPATEDDDNYDHEDAVKAEAEL
jgi:hypothetical protein